MHLADDDTPLGTTHVNPLDLLQARVEAEVEDPFGRGGTARLVAGRTTVDLGSRRLLARNNFRNTINAFTGVDLEWRSPGDRRLRAFLLVPVERRPTDEAGLRDHALRADREETGTVVWGVLHDRPVRPGGMRAEAYVVALHERDAAGASSGRRRWTPGLRLTRSPAPARVDLELEVAVQAGSSPSPSGRPDAPDLTQRAWFVHASAGYTFPAAWRPRVAASFHGTSGDADPADDRDGRWDTLFGARRSELGPTGFWGAVARGNLLSPALRVEARPDASVTAGIAWRPVWLARRRDAWTGAGLRDPGGRSGRFVGHQVEALARWSVRPGLTLEAGATVLRRGRFARTAPGALQDPDEPLHLYVQASVGR